MDDIEPQGMIMERKSLQNSDGKSDKFWTITLTGSQYTVQYGRVGTTGQSQTKTFMTIHQGHGLVSIQSRGIAQQTKFALLLSPGSDDPFPKLGGELIGVR